MSESPTTEPKEKGSSAPSESAPAEPFQRAVAAYHDCAGQAVQQYAERLQQLNQEYTEAVQKASRAPSYEEEVQALDTATRHYNQQSQDNIDAADAAVGDCLRGYVGRLQDALGCLDANQVDPATLAYIASETAFIAQAAAGEFPPAWWLPVDGE